MGPLEWVCKSKFMLFMSTARLSDSRGLSDAALCVLYDVGFDLSMVDSNIPALELTMHPTNPQYCMMFPRPSAL